MTNKKTDGRRAVACRARQSKAAAPDAADRKEAARRKASGKRWSKSAEKAFLAHLSATGNVQASCRAAGFSTTALYARRKADAALAAAWKEALADGYIVLEAELLRRAIEGTEKPCRVAGDALASVTTYPDAMAMRLLQSHRAETASLRAAQTVRTQSDAQARAQFIAMLRDIRDRLLADDMAPIGDDPMIEDRSNRGDGSGDDPE